ncbi:protein-ADP-ribose hydrolase [Staphylococcus simiae]|uniref:protein-ADP-ribose hydrolase n=1 Tax=Staphylococcus simiae TaxID=308354 RepID=UPI001A9645B1|nr:protein-ADP-ribose hydrolase [Staphylococcus simiae]MBO1198728.1 protein-ADP-ribose hydrolase [Staphylococcus simiae]MBO1200980.1 protein-ADP-ribose hydrolase [Staphylococcus simiae]MBO1203175.1 protein-ADP-ribose hydrolase [Staphylococcus simiae]MBO1210717.1 protein-ADP-ribose hydrolase [Staphylococcus simiae]MBO1229318.1 protein-ADP-ribose hydrolase [Staphylococcus simiae]
MIQPETNQQRLFYLTNYMWQELYGDKPLDFPTTFNEQWELYRGLANVRPPHSVSNAYLTIQDELLSNLNEQHVVTINDLQPIEGDNIYLWQGDITRLAVDGIVNAANSALLGCMQANHDCIDNIIHTKAGVQVRLDCHDIITRQGRKESVGKAKLTSAYNLPAQYIIHTVGPQVRKLPVSDMNQNLLAKCYLSCLKLADQQGLHHLAFCCISTGVFGYPQQEAAEIAIHTVRQYLAQTKSTLKVIFNVFKDEDLQIYKEALVNG